MFKVGWCSAPHHGLRLERAPPTLITVIRVLFACPHAQGTHEDKENVHIVMELCGGGELFDSIVESGSFSEKKAALVFRKMVEVVSVI